MLLPCSPCSSANGAGSVCVEGTKGERECGTAQDLFKHILHLYLLHTYTHTHTHTQTHTFGGVQIESDPVIRSTCTSNRLDEMSADRLIQLQE